MYAKKVSLIYTLSKNGPKFIFSSHCYKVREDTSKMALDYMPAVKKLALCLFVIVSYVPSRLFFFVVVCLLGCCCFLFIFGFFVCGFLCCLLLFFL